MTPLPLRIPAQADLRETLAGLGAGHGVDAAFVVQEIGSLSVVRTTAEVLVMLLPGHRFSREIDPATGYREWSIRPAESSIATSR